MERVVLINELRERKPVDGDRVSEPDRQHGKRKRDRAEPRRSHIGRDDIHDQSTNADDFEPESELGGCGRSGVYVDGERLWFPQWIDGAMERVRIGNQLCQWKPVDSIHIRQLDRERGQRNRDGGQPWRSDIKLSDIYDQHGG